MNLLVLGSGAREHAVLAALADSSHTLYCAPGNAGTEALAESHPLDLADPDAALALARRLPADLTIVGPELPLSVGVVDGFEAVGLPIVGPTAAAARLETSKAWAKEFMARHRVPTARFVVAETETAAVEIARAGTLGWPLVIKADGLASGKGVVLADDLAKAEATLRDMMSLGRFGAAGSRVVLEECLSGPELSFFLLTDGEHAMELGTAQDHKRAFDDDRGPNTGGMGAFSPSPLANQALTSRVTADVVRPVIDGMRAEGYPYRGFLYCGLMLTARGPMVIEFNARLGDPETQVLLPFGEPLLPLLQAVATGTLPARPAVAGGQRRVGVVVASGGYPGQFATGKQIDGLQAAASIEGVRVFHAGTKRSHGHVVSAGGRVLTVVGEGPTFESAMARAYAAVDRIHFDGAFSRRDIGKKAQEPHS